MAAWFIQMLGPCARPDENLILPYLSAKEMRGAMTCNIILMPYSNLLDYKNIFECDLFVPST